MSDIAIRCQGLSKQYRIGERESYKALREVITEAAAAPFRRVGNAFRRSQSTISNGNGLRSTKVTNGDSPLVRAAAIGNRQSAIDNALFWALDDVSFETKRGEVVGIIGRNGAGKSTLLKILSRITKPTRGHAEIHGRVGSLLEVGTGFHPELTGRENIYLNAAILGMRKAEVERKFAEIVAFAEMEKFIDTPVKRYSSGMYMRLAFAVAAHLDPEILIIDEVLAVGDMSFQRKCLGKMDEVAKQGRTVLLVSHNLVAISQLCGEAIWLDSGRIKRMGKATEVVQAYSRDQASKGLGTFSPQQNRGDGRVELISYRVTNGVGEIEPLPATNEDLLIHVQLRVREPIAQPACGVSIVNAQGILMTSINSVELSLELAPFPQGEIELAIKLSRIAFLPGNYTASFWVMNPQCHIFAMAENAISFEVRQTPLYGNCQVDHRWGCVYTQVSFTQLD